MGSIITAPVNEAANLLTKISPEIILSLRKNYPEIAQDLQSGQMAGDDDQNNELKKNIIYAKAQLMIAALSETRRLCDIALPEAALRIKRGSNIRLGSQIITTVATSGVLGALGATKPVLAAVSGFFALIASISALCADYLERVIDPGKGSLATMYTQLVNARYKAGSLHDTLTIQVEYGGDISEIEKTIGDGNSLCEEVNVSVFQIIQKFNREQIQ